MRFLVLGASGMAGHVVALYLQEQGHEVIGYARRRVPEIEKFIVGDACEEKGLRNAVEASDADVIVNAIGILNKDADANKSSAVYLNAYLPHRLAEFTAQSASRVCQISTDCVFCGNTGPYSEDSIPDGLTWYDRTKALGELRDDKNLTLRQSIVGPDINANGIGLLNWFMHQDSAVAGFTGAKWTGLTTLELAKAIEAAAGQSAAGLTNMVPSSNISKFELLKLFSEYLREGRVVVVPSTELQLDKTLVRTNFSIGFIPASYERQIQEMAEWIDRHKDMYKHYNSHFAQ